jgi:hypothetical protein
MPDGNERIAPASPQAYILYEFAYVPCIATTGIKAKGRYQPSDRECPGGDIGVSDNPRSEATKFLWNFFGKPDLVPAKHLLGYHNSEVYCYIKLVALLL